MGVPGLTGKTILILSPQAWGKMFVSKHHYAIGLAKRGNTVYFLNPPDQEETERKEAIEITSSGIDSHLFLIEHRLFFPYRFKFRALPLFHWLMKFHVNHLLKKINRPVDIVWSFDLGNLYPLHFFGKQPYKIFHPVDEPLNAPAIEAARGAEIIFSVTKEILEKYTQFNVPRHFINHGLSEEFIYEGNTTYQKNEPLHIGFSGNLLRPDIDQEIVLTIISENRNCIFDFWGSYSMEQANIGGGDDARTKEFIAVLKNQSNVVLHGAVDSKLLAREIAKMDAFLICYDVERDQSKGTNYHKIMEFLATGKVIISNNITTYDNQPNFVCMVKNRDHNKLLPALFMEVVNNLDRYNSDELRIQRIAFAANNSYEKQIGRIENSING